MIGGSDYAIAIIVTIFMAGLGLGSKFSGWLASRLKQPRRALLIFGCMEILTGVYALALPSFAPITKPVLVYLYAFSMESALLYHVGALVICTILLIFPVLLMGATLPLLCTAMVNSLEKSRHGVPILYGINTLGAATGALMAGFVLIYRIGVHATTIVAASINIMIGIACFFLFRRLPCTDTVDVSHQQHHAEDRSVEKNVHLARWALVITFISGFVSLSSEVIWTKMLGLLAGPTTFSFSIVLFCYILCLGLGSMLAVFLIRRDSSLLPTLLVVQVIIGVSIVAVSQLLGDSSLLFAKLAYTFQGSPTFA
jgi:spermidine synthase